MIRPSHVPLPARSRSSARPPAAFRPRSWARPGSPSGARRALRIATLLLALVAAGTGVAQDLDSDAVLDNVQARAETVVDTSFLLTGGLIDPDGTEITLEIEVQIIPETRVASAYILQPDALADNIIVWDDDAVYNYVYLTNQVTIFDAGDPDALGGLLGEREVDTDEVELTLDLRELLAAYEATGNEYVDTPAGPAYRLTFTNDSEDANFGSVIAEVLDGEWIPYSLELIQPDGNLLARLVFENVVIDEGLEAGDVTFLPEDAEVFDERE